MQPSRQLWRRPASQQGRCHCLSRRALRAVNLSQPDAQDHRIYMVNVSFKVEYKCPYGQSLALVGNAMPLGNWSSKRGQRMHWSRGDVWTCNVMLPAGSDIECKYVIVDEQGREQRWQEGNNMAVKVPTTCQGLPVQRYDVGISWCKNYANYRAQPMNIAAAAAVGELSKVACGTISPATVAAAPASETAAVAPVMAWAVSKGANTSGRLNPGAVAQQGAAIQATQHLLSPTTASDVSTTTLCAPPLPLSAPVKMPKDAELLLAAAPQTDAVAGSKTATLMQAAASAAHNSQATAAASPAFETPIMEAVAAGAPLTSFQLSSVSGGDGESTISIVLPPRSKSPPVKISLSSNFSRLMDVPAMTRNSSGGGSVTPTAGNGAANPVASVTSADTAAHTAVTGKATTGGVQSHAIDLDFAGSMHTSHVSGGNGSSQAHSPSLTGKPPLFTSGNPDSAMRSLGQSRHITNPHTAANPVWGMEYDMYAAAYGLPYMHTSFDLEAYALYDRVEPEPSKSVFSSSSLGSTHGPHLFLSASKACGADPLESAVQAALSSPTAYIPASGADLLSSELLGATAASTALAISSGIATAPASGSAATEVLTSQPMEAARSAIPRDVDGVAEAVVSPSLDIYRQVSRSSTSVSDWAGRTLIEMSSGRPLIDDDSDEETADDEAAIAQALASPVAPADMAALLTQLGAALGRSVRLRYDGIDATALDLLELDRKIALAASKLYRQRDSLLTGWLRKETRRQLATVAAAPAGRPAMSSSNTVTPI